MSESEHLPHRKEMDKDISKKATGRRSHAGGALREAGISVKELCEVTSKCVPIGDREAVLSKAASKIAETKRADKERLLLTLLMGVSAEKPSDFNRFLQESQSKFKDDLRSTRFSPRLAAEMLDVAQECDGERATILNILKGNTKQEPAAEGASAASSIDSPDDAKTREADIVARVQKMLLSCPWPCPAVANSMRAMTYGNPIKRTQALSQLLDAVTAFRARAAAYAHGLENKKVDIEANVWKTKEARILIDNALRARNSEEHLDVLWSAWSSLIKETSGDVAANTEVLKDNFKESVSDQRQRMAEAKNLSNREKFSEKYAKNKETGRRSHATGALRKAGVSIKELCEVTSKCKPLGNREVVISKAVEKIAEIKRTDKERPLLALLMEVTGEKPEEFYRFLKGRRRKLELPTRLPPRLAEEMFDVARECNGERAKILEILREEPAGKDAEAASSTERPDDEELKVHDAHEDDVVARVQTILLTCHWPCTAIANSMQAMAYDRKTNKRSRALSKLLDVVKRFRKRAADAPWRRSAAKALIDNALCARNPAEHLDALWAASFFAIQETQNDVSERIEKSRASFHTSVKKRSANIQCPCNLQGYQATDPSQEAYLPEPSGEPEDASESHRSELNRKIDLAIKDIETEVRQRREALSMAEEKDKAVDGVAKRDGRRRKKKDSDDRIAKDERRTKKIDKPLTGKTVYDKLIKDPTCPVDAITDGEFNALKELSVRKLHRLQDHLKIACSPEKQDDYVKTKLANVDGLAEGQIQEAFKRTLEAYAKCVDDAKKQKKDKNKEGRKPLLELYNKLTTREGTCPQLSDDDCKLIQKIPLKTNDMNLQLAWEALESRCLVDADGYVPPDAQEQDKKDIKEKWRKTFELFKSCILEKKRKSLEKKLGRR